MIEYKKGKYCLYTKDKSRCLGEFLTFKTANNRLEKIKGKRDGKKKIQSNT